MFKLIKKIIFLIKEILKPESLSEKYIDNFLKKKEDENV